MNPYIIFEDVKMPQGLLYLYFAHISHMKVISDMVSDKHRAIAIPLVLMVNQQNCPNILRTGIWAS